jgi:hypothetical protein
VSRLIRIFVVDISTDVAVIFVGFKVICIY